jgi:dienelactone hydrolase
MSSFLSSEPLHLSPSEYHLRQLPKQPSLGYQGGPVELWQDMLRPKLKALLGWERYASVARVPLNPRTLWRRETPEGVLEKVVFTAEPYAEVVGYLCLPKAKEPCPALICLQGHNSGAHLSIAVSRDDDLLPIVSQKDQDFGLQCLRNGVVGFCLEIRSFGERRERKQEKTHQSHCLDAALHALLLGHTLLAERIFDVDRVLDYLATRREVDMARVGILGESGGGTVGLYASALLPRLRFTVVACGFCSFREGLMKIPHCGDNYVPGLLPVAEMADIAGLLAPNPLLIVAGNPDAFYPLPAVQEAFTHVKRIYDVSGASAACRFALGQDGHRFYADLAWPAIREFAP